MKMTSTCFFLLQTSSYWLLFGSLPMLMNILTLQMPALQAASIQTHAYTWSKLPLRPQDITCVFQAKWHNCKPTSKNPPLLSSAFISADWGSHSSVTFSAVRSNGQKCDEVYVRSRGVLKHSSGLCSNGRYTPP